MKRLLILLVCLFVILIPSASADNELNLNSETVKESSGAASITESVDEYQLPYPGILPDNPLYPVKTFRDRIVSFLITDTLKKAEFNLLQADKRLQAGVYLIDKSNKHDLAVETISKGENYFEEAINKTIEASKQKIEIGNMQDKLKKSALKHEKLITGLLEKAPRDKKSGYSTLLKRVEKYKKEVSKLKSS